MEKHWGLVLWTVNPGEVNDNQKPFFVCIQKEGGLRNRI